MTLKLISYNIWHGKHTDRVVELIRHEHPDVVHLQEVTPNGSGLHGHTIPVWDEILSGTGMQGVYEKIWEVEFGETVSEMGLGVLSRGKIMESMLDYYVNKSGLRMPFSDFFDKPSDIPRALQVVTHDLGGMRIATMNTHFSWTPDGEVTDYQLRDVQALNKLLDTYKRGIFSGDLNTPTGSVVHEVLAEGWKDVSGTEPTLHPTIHPAGDKNYHVDYVFYRGEGIEHLDTQIPVIGASDHLPVVCEFEIR
jgi:endonuclease/exonuclease/phosphatase family metal-dependent hydrolase